MNPTIVPTRFTVIDDVRTKMKAMSNSVNKFARDASEKFERAGKTAFKVGRQSAIVGAIFAAPLVYAGKQAVQFEERMSDVGKTTGMEGKELSKFGDELLSMSTKTRTSIDDLATIAEIGGQLGVPRKEMLKFTAAANQFSIALGSDFSGGVEEAVSTISKMKGLFKDTRDLDISTSISLTGSAINELGAVGNGTSANMADFALRMGALPDALKASATQTLAMGAYLEEMGIDSQIASGGLSNLLLVAGKNLPKFAQQMGVSANEAKALLATDPSGFAAKFSQSFKGMAPDKLAQKLSDLKIGSQETIKVVGALSSDQVNMATGMTRLATLQGISNKAFAEGTSLKSEAEKKEKTAAAQMAKLKNNVQALAITVGTALLPVINGLVESITPYVQGAAQWIQKNKGLTTTIVKVVAGLSAAAFAISGISFAVGSAQKALALGKIAMSAFGTSSTAALGPVGAIIGVLAVGGAALYAYIKANDTYRSSEQLSNEVRDEALQRTLDQRVEVQQLFNTLRTAKQGTDEYRAAVEAVEKMSPGLTEKYNLQTASIQQLNMAEKELTASIIERAKQEVAAEKAKEKYRQALDLQDKGIGFLDKAQAFVNNSIMYGAGNSLTGEGSGMRSAEEWKQFKIDNLNQQGDELTKMSMPNPEAAKSNSILNSLNINITGLPAGSSAEMDGKQVNSTGGLMPKLASTR